MIKADFHLHTNCSDGRLAPADLVKEAAASGLTVIAITDHDTISGYEEARKTGLNLGVTVVPGLEITTMFDGREAHLLGYFFSVRDNNLLALMQRQQGLRKDRVARIVHKLAKLGIPLDAEQILASHKQAPGRPAVAAALQRGGFVKSQPEAFARFLGEGAPAYVPLDYIRIEDAITCLHDAGGVAILAHPGLHYSDKQLQYLCNAGLDGLEYIHPSHPFEVQQKHLKWAEGAGLLATGGSDYHGFTSRDRQFLGVVAVDASVAGRLRNRSQMYKTEKV